MAYSRQLVTVVVLLLLATLLMLSLGCGPDRGRCLVAHTEMHHEPESCSMKPLIIGDMTIYIEECEPPYDWNEVVCDRWEFPNGRAEKDDPR